MPEWLSTAWAAPGLIWLFLAVVVAGLVRGFAGFGSPLIIMPAASSVLMPFGALIFLCVVELVGPLPNLPGALRKGERRDVLLLLISAAVALPFGLALVQLMLPEVFNWGVSIIVIVMLGLLMTGWRYEALVGRREIVGVGLLGGFLGGVSGLAGPPVVMFYLASTRTVEIIRANFNLYLLGINVLTIAALTFFAQFDGQAFAAGLLLILPYIAANAAGARLFRPEREKLFRGVAYTAIGGAAILGLPLWSQ